MRNEGYLGRLLVRLLIALPSTAVWASAAAAQTEPAAQPTKIDTREACSPVKVGSGNMTVTCTGVLREKPEVPEGIFRSLKIGRLGETSYSYIKSLLGTPRSVAEPYDPPDGSYPEPGMAEFVAGGYLVRAYFVRPDNAVGLEIRVDPDLPNANRDRIEVSGPWIPSTGDATGSMVPDMTSGATIGATKLQNFTTYCKAFYFEGGLGWNRDEEWFCRAGGDGVDGELYRDFFIDDSDYAISNIAGVINYLDMMKSYTEVDGAFDEHKMRDDYRNLAGDTTNYAPIAWGEAANAFLLQQGIKGSLQQKNEAVRELFVREAFQRVVVSFRLIESWAELPEVQLGIPYE